MKKLILLLMFCISLDIDAQVVELRADSTIVSSKLRIKNHNEGLGKVLTSDANGNANWQSIPVSTNFWQIGSSSTEIIPNSPITKVKIPGTLQIPTGAGTNKYLKSIDASGNAAWATFPTLNLSLPYSGSISTLSPAFSIENTSSVGYAFQSMGNILLKNINEAPDRILFSTDDQGDAKWFNGNCINRCSFSLTRDSKASLGGGVDLILPFSIENFDKCNQSTLVTNVGLYDFHYFTAPIDGIYQFEFNGTFLATSNFTLSIHTLDLNNSPSTLLFASACLGNALETSQRYTAIIKLTAGQKIAPTIKASISSGAAFNNSGNSVFCSFSGHLVEATDCKLDN